MFKKSLYDEWGIFIIMLPKIAPIKYMFLCLINFSVSTQTYDFSLKCFDLKNKRYLLVNFISLFKGMVFFV